MAPPGEPPTVVETANGPTPNGPVRNEVKPWQRAWNTEEMRRNSSNWTLASDAGLLNFLQEFSQQMISRTHEVEKSLDDLIHETKVTSSRISNTINDFHMLSNMQFVESRVYDEDISEEATVEPKKPEQKTKEQKEAELLSRIKSALHLGLQVVDQAFNRVDIQQESESEEEEEGGRPLEGGILLEPKDPYSHRSLPYIIGTKYFHEDDLVGLSDMLSEEEFEDESKSKEYESEPSSESEAEEEIWNKNIVKPAVEKPPAKEQYSDQTSESGSSDLFRDEKPEKDNISEDSFSAEDAPATTKHHRPNFADELAAKLRIPTTRPEDKENSMDENGKISSTEKDDSKAKEKPAVLVHERKQSAIRPNIHKEIDEDDDDLFGTSSTAEDSLFNKKDGLFSGGGRLFDDQNEEGDLFDSVDKPVTKEERKSVSKDDEKLIEPRKRGRTSSGKVIYPGSVSIFGDVTDKVLNIPRSDDSSPTKQSPQEKQVEEPKKAEKKSSPLASGTGLFDGSEDEDDLFASLPKKPTSITSPRKGTGTNAFRSVSLFSDEDQVDGGIFEEIHTTHSSSSVTPSDADPAKKIPTGGVSLFDGLVGELGAAIKAKKLPGDTDSEDEASPEVESKSSLNATKVAGDGLKGSQSNSTSSSSIFTEDPENKDLFTKKEVKQTKKSSKSSLFGADSDLFGDDDDLFTAKPTVRKQTGLSLYEDEDLFSTGSKKEEKIVQVKEPPKVEKKRTATQVSLFDDDDDNDDLFSLSSGTQPVGLASQTKENSSKDIVDSIVNEDMPVTEISKDIPKTRAHSSTAKSLFEDEDLLFGGPASESPEVDLFSVQPSDGTKEQGSKEQPKKSSPSISKTISSEISRKTAEDTKASTHLPTGDSSPTRKKPVGGVALFGGIDMFKTKSTEVNQEKGEPVKTAEEVKSVEPEPVKVIEKVSTQPTMKNSEEVSVNFDKPVDTSNTLSCASKDRVKIQTRRRPPSRRGRQASLQQPVDTSPNVNINNAETHGKTDLSATQVKSPLSSSLFESTTISSKRESTEVLTSPSTEEEDVFVAIDAPQKVLSPVERPKQKDLFSSYSGVKKKDITLGFEDNNLFSTGSTSSKSSEKEDIFSVKGKDVTNIGSETKDIFSDLTVNSSKSKTDIFSGSDAVSKKSGSIFDNVDDDIFSNTSFSKGITSKPSTTVKAASQVKEDDIFQNPPKSSKAMNKNSESADIFSDTSYDIFASIPVREPVKLKSASKPLFDNDIDDLFSPVSKPSPATSKEKPSKKTHIESNNTSIFDDPLLGNHSDSAD